MTPTIAIYVEGGGDAASGKAQLRQGFDALLRAQKEAARARRLGWKLVMCGGRGAAYDAFIHTAMSANTTIAVLLVDSEGPVSGSDAAGRVSHLSARDGWDLSAISSDRVHLMVQCMEAWIVADAEAVERFYGKDFVKSALPTRQNLEDEPKLQLYQALSRASQKTQKGEYGKIKHASQILARVDPSKIAARCKCFSVFTKWLEGAIAEAA